MHNLRMLLLITMLLMSSTASTQSDEGYTWLAGDHHIHSRYSVSWNRDVDPPTPVRGGDAIYPIHMNALMGKYFGLSWTVATDHGGPNHSKVNLEWAYPELVQSRLAVPEVVQFWGMEFDTPGADHSSLIIPFTENEARQLFELESTWAKREPWPSDATWNTESRMLAALREMRDMQPPPLLIANHPSRSASGFGQYGVDDPAELRGWNDTAPNVAVGMAGAPGHQAATLLPDGTASAERRARGGYGNYPTHGGFDQMTARVGGFWDSMIGEGRDWWITANSDSHVHYSEGGSDFWPGEYSKTYVWAQKNHESIMDGIRNGRIFVTTGDLIHQLFVSAESNQSGATAEIGGTLTVAAGDSVTVTISFQDPDRLNNNGDNPLVRRVDLITGSISKSATDPADDTNTSTRVIARFGQSEWSDLGTFRSVSYTLSDIRTNTYLRVRGTNGNELEPEPDPRGEDPWTDLWFYSNPIRILIDK